MDRISNIPQSSIGLGILVVAPTTPTDDSSATTATYPSKSRTASSPSGTSSACSSRDFMSFTSHFAISLCRRMPIKGLSSIPSDMTAHTHHVLNTTQVSLSVVVLALRIMKQVQEKLDALVSGAKRGEGGQFGESLGDAELNVLDRLSGTVTAKTLLVASLMLAMKSPNGCCNTFTNATWSQVAAVPVRVLCSVEMDIALLLGFNLWVNEQQYLVWLNTVRNAAEDFSFKTAQLHHQQQQQQQQRQAKAVIAHQQQLPQQQGQQRVRKQIPQKEHLHPTLQAYRFSGMLSPSSPIAPSAEFLFNQTMANQRRKSLSKSTRLAPYARETGLSPQRMQSLMQSMQNGSFAEKIVGMMIP
ncbi:hypothetical protein HDU81_009817, partial [Chytriomyces hyalinus]